MASAGGGRAMADLSEYERHAFLRRLTEREASVDPATGLYVRHRRHGLTIAPRAEVRDSAELAQWWLLRGQAGDNARAVAMLRAVLAQQYDRPGEVYHGTWKRTPTEPDPAAEPMIWRDFDPNWREFIGSTLVVVLAKYERRLPADLVAAVDAALVRAVEGTLARPVPASYANIALMRGFLLDWCGQRFGRDDWRGQAEAYAREVYAVFAEHDAFDEFNSATYYAIDLAALGNWVTYAPSAVLRELGLKMEAGLWRDIGLFYHAGMRNLCGPFDRSYGMDMPTYGSGLGGWIGGALGRPLHPLESEGAAGLFTGVRVPAEVMPHLQAFQGERLIERQIGSAPRRVATAWLSERLMLGGEDASFAKPLWGQYHMATAHWRTPDDGIGWMRLVPTLPTDARAERGRLTLWCYQWHGTGGRPIRFRFEISAAGADAAGVSRDRWALPGLEVDVQTNALGPTVAPGASTLDITYNSDNLDSGTMVRFALTFRAV